MTFKGFQQTKISKTNCTCQQEGFVCTEDTGTHLNVLTG